MTTRKGKDAATAPDSQLTNIRPFFISLVDFGANHGGRDHHFALKADMIGKSVPEADASDEDKRKALVARADSYGIAAQDDAHLSYPADAPTTETLYGDPVNLKYPFCGTDNQPDADRLRNALARFKQNAGTYADDASRGRVYARIVRAALEAGIDVSYDAADPVDALLPQDLKDRLTKADDEPNIDANQEDIEAKIAVQVAAHPTVVAAQAALNAAQAQASAATYAMRIVEQKRAETSGVSLDDVAALRATVKAQAARLEEFERATAAHAAEKAAMQQQLTTAVAKAARLERQAPQMGGLAVDEATDGVTQRRAPTYPDRYGQRA